MWEFTASTDFLAFRRNSEVEFLDKVAWCVTEACSRVTGYGLYGNDQNGAVFIMDAASPDGKEHKITCHFSHGWSDSGNVVIGWRLDEPDSVAQSLELPFGASSVLTPKDVANKILDIIG